MYRAAVLHHKVTLLDLFGEERSFTSNKQGRI
jgi:hypothetical protein